MTFSDRIKQKFGSSKRFAEILKAPMATVYTWTSSTNDRKPKAWQEDAYLDAATLREHSVDGWKCRSCGAISEASGPATYPGQCGFCHSVYFNPVRIVEDPAK